MREDYAFVVRDGAIVDAGDFRRGARAMRATSQTGRFPPTGSSCRASSTVTATRIRFCCAAGPTILPFAKWRSDALYHVVPRLTPDDVYWIFVAAFSEMLAAGITTVAEFFYLNGEGTRTRRPRSAPRSDTGIRLVFARTWMDADYAPPRVSRERSRWRRERTRELMQRYPEANVCVAPHSLHAASHEMIRAAAEFAREHDCMLHVHVAEASYEGEQTLRTVRRTPIALLEELGALNERTVAIHAIYHYRRRPRALAASGARVVHNPMTNQYLGDGICDVTELQSTGRYRGSGHRCRRAAVAHRRRCARPRCCRRSGISTAAHRARTQAYAMGTAQGARALARCRRRSRRRMRRPIISCSMRRRSIRGRRRSTRWSIAARMRGCRRRSSRGRRVYVGEPSATGAARDATLQPSIARALSLA